MFSPHSPETRDRRKRTKALRLSVRFCVGGAGVGVILEGWSSAPRSCSQEAGCGTPGRRPGPSHPDWSPEGGWWEGTCPSLSHSAPTLYSYSPPSYWNTQRERPIRRTLLVSNERVYWFSTTLFLHFGWKQRIWFESSLYVKNHETWPHGGALKIKFDWILSWSFTW